MSKVLKNLFYQVIFQITKIILPIVTVPIVARALGPNGIGLYNYTSSIIQYFLMIGGLGFSLYGSREIAITVAKKKNISERFWEIFISKAIITGLATIVLFIFLIFAKNKTMLLLQSINMIYIFLDISWFFMGIENFKTTSLSSLISQILGFICIVLLINDESDIYIYIVIQAVSLVLPTIITWLVARKYISFVSTNINKLFIDIKQSVYYFIPQISNTIFSNINKTMAGLFLTSRFVGYYSNSLVLNTVFITIITTLDTVMLPRLSSYHSNNQGGKLVSLFLNNIKSQLFFSIGVMFGMLTVYDKLIPWFLGNKFLFVTKMVPVLSILIVVVPFSMTIARQYLLPQGRTKEYNRTIILGAITTVFLDVILIAKFSVFGVLITHVFVEIMVLIFRLYGLKKDRVTINFIDTILKYLVSGIIMMILTRFLTKNAEASFVTNFIQMCIGGSIYFLITALLGENLLFNIFFKKRKN